MGSKWKKVKAAFGLNLCVYAHKNLVADNDDDDESLPPSERRSDAALISPPPSSIKLRLSKTLSRSSSQKICSICLATMRRGDGQAVFTAECSHSFHFHCITSSVKHGNRICPVCRAKWTAVPLRCPNPGSPPCPNPIGARDNNFTTLIRRLPPARSTSSRNPIPILHPQEPAVFSDDESLDHIPPSTNPSSDKTSSDFKMDIKTYTEVPAIPKSTSVETFTVLIHLKAPLSNSWHNVSKTGIDLNRVSPTPRAAVDLITVLDISGSMAGTKLALLKRAMGFLIQNLGPNDRLSVIAFSSAARRLFPLCRMTESGRQQALQAVNSLVANGGTNIAEGLRKGAKIIEDRREKNPVSSIILLSDGQDTYTINSSSSSGQNRNRNPPRYEMLLPSSFRSDRGLGFKTPVHTFGFGADHDSASMHSISEMSGGTFSFIEAEGVIQDAFAQCIGGLLSVVVKDLRVSVECVDPNIRLVSLKAGSFPTRTLLDRRMGSIDVGDLYADEERDFLLVLNVPAEVSCSETSLLKVKCVYNDPLRKESVILDEERVQIQRTDVARLENVSVEVDRQKNRIQAAEAMAKARAAAENGDLGGAVSVLEDVRKVLSETVSARCNDRLCLALDSELKEMQERMVSRHVYEASGRAYILSGLSSHSWQRATARGDSMDGTSLVHAYQTPSMVEMVTRSQASLVGSPSNQRILRPFWSFGSQPRPR